MLVEWRTTTDQYVSWTVLLEKETAPWHKAVKMLAQVALESERRAADSFAVQVFCQTLKINIDTRHLSSSEKWTQFRPDGIKKSAQFDLKNETDRNHLDTNLTSSSAFFPLSLFWSGSNAKIKIDLDTYNLSLRTKIVQTFFISSSLEWINWFAKTTDILRVWDESFPAKLYLYIVNELQRKFKKAKQRTRFFDWFRKSLFLPYLNKDKIRYTEATGIWAWQMTLNLWRCENASTKYSMCRIK